MTLTNNGQRLAGTLSSFNLNFDASGNLSEAEPGSGPGSEVVAARLYSGVLHIKVRDLDTGDTLELELKLVENAKAELSHCGRAGNARQRRAQAADSHP